MDFADHERVDLLMQRHDQFAWFLPCMALGHMEKIESMHNLHAGFALHGYGMTIDFIL